MHEPDTTSMPKLLINSLPEETPVHESLGKPMALTFGRWGVGPTMALVSPFKVSMLPTAMGSWALQSFQPPEPSLRSDLLGCRHVVKLRV